jgi:PAS domain S-box-containing protein
MARPTGYERLFWAVFRRSRNAMVLLDDQRRHVEVNGAYLKLVGLPRAGLIGARIDPLIAGGPHYPLPEFWQRVSRGDLLGEREIVRPDGSIVAVQAASHPAELEGQRRVLVVILRESATNRRRWGDATPTGAALTTRERQVIELVALGHTGPEVGDELHISHDTVRTHVRNAMRKTGARSRAELVAKALADGHIAVADQ